MKTYGDWFFAFLAVVCAAIFAGILIATVYAVTRPESYTTPAPQFGTTSPNCGYLYNVSKHKEWADCMGVDYITPIQMKRDDL